MDPTAVTQVLQAFGPTTGIIILGLVAAIIYQTRRYEKALDGAMTAQIAASKSYEALLERSLAAAASATKAQADTALALVEMREALKITDRLIELAKGGSG